MKPVTVGLIVAAAVCAASTVYFWTQLNEERERAAQVADTAKRLQARVAELEKARANFSARMAGGGMFGGGALAQGGPGAATLAAPAAAEEGANTSEEPHAIAFRPDRSPAMQRMMRNQIRANNKRVYGDLAEQLGLSKEDANKLYDLLTDQQTSMMDRMRNREENGEPPRFEDVHREQAQQLTDLLGPDKAQALTEYQNTLPARGEVEMIARQLEGSDAALNDDQRKKLVAALTEERQRVPAPEFTEGMDAEQYSKSMTDWQNNYNERAADRAKSILNSDQQTAYAEYQQLQSEMWQQFATMGPVPRRARAQGGAVAGNVAVYQAGPPVAISEVVINAPPPPPANANPKSR
jgi:hypothetical protein